MSPASQLKTSSPSGAPAAGVVLCGAHADLLDFHRSFARDASRRCRLAPTLADAYQAAANLSPCVLIVEQDTLHPDYSAALRVWLAIDPRRHILVFTADTRPENLINLLRMGYSGYLRHGSSCQTVYKAVESVECGELWAGRKIVAAALRDVTSLLTESKLTAREIEILERISAGDDNRRIADDLFITRETVRWHLRSAYSKLGVHDRHIAARLGSHHRPR